MAPCWRGQVPQAARRAETVVTRSWARCSQTRGHSVVGGPYQVPRSRSEWRADNLTIPYRTGMCASLGSHRVRTDQGAEPGSRGGEPPPEACEGGDGGAPEAHEAGWSGRARSESTSSVPQMAA